MMNLRNRCLSYCTREAVNGTSFSEWWNSEYSMYEVDGLEINFVPKIIFCRNNEEVGRIIEMPYESLEKDMLEIVKKWLTQKNGSLIFEPRLLNY